MRFAILFALLWSSISFGAIPKASMIIQRASENAGEGAYQIEQEVQFPNGQDIVTLRESWLIENENNMKLVVTGTKELKDQISFMVQINNGNRTQGAGAKRITEDFIERYFHLRTTDSLAQMLIQLKLAPGNVLAKKPVLKKDVEYQPENFVRLARAGGVIAFAFGGLSTPEKAVPGFWIEQDSFAIRKFRLPTDVEVVADRFTSYPKGLLFPKTRMVKWGENQVTIQTVSVNSRGKEAMAQFGSKVPTKLGALQNLQAAPVIEDFYRRFR